MDPRADAADSYLAVGLDQWRVELMDQAVRRLLAGIRDWAPVVDRSRNGVELLITLSFLRNTLVSLPARWDSVSAEVSALRHLCRVLAMHLELHSGTDVRPHPEVLPWVDGSARPIGELDGLDTLVTRAWMRQLQHTEKEMARR